MNKPPTKVQLEILRDVAVLSKWYWEGYKPAQIALKNGWVRKNRWDRLEITDDGRTVLAESGKL